MWKPYNYNDLPRVQRTKCFTLNTIEFDLFQRSDLIVLLSFCPEKR